MDIQTAIVTGGTGLLGRVLVHDLLTNGVRVAVPYRDEKKYRLFRGGVTEGGLLFGKQCDTSKPDQAEQFVQWARDRMSAPIEALICATGWWTMSKFANTSFEAWQQLFDSNVTSVFNICKAVVPEMQVRNRGKVITLGGPGGLDPKIARHQVAYSAAKAALVAFTEGLAAETYQHDVQVNMVVPSEIVPTAEANTRPGVTPEDVVKAIKWLLSNDAAKISGAVIKVYGNKLV